MNFIFQWPFVRIFGLQEPASVVFSLLNLYAHVTMYMTFQKTANRKTPMFYVWSYFTLVSFGTSKIESIELN